MFPMVASDNENWQSYFKNYEKSLVNGYSGDINRPWLDKHIIVKFDSDKLTTLNVDELARNENFYKTNTCMINKKYYDLYAMMIPDEYLEEYELIKDGDYFNITAKLKHKIIRFWDIDINSEFAMSFFVKHKNDIVPKNIKEEIVEEETYINKYFKVIPPQTEIPQVD